MHSESYGSQDPQVQPLPPYVPLSVREAGPLSVWCFFHATEAADLLKRALPLVAHAVDVPRRELEAQEWMRTVELLAAPTNGGN